MPSLYRLFPREAESSQRYSNATEAVPDGTRPMSIDPWRVTVNTASGSREGFSRCLQWLCVFARSGVDVPVSTYAQFSSLAGKFEISVDEALLLVNAMFASSWLKSTGRDQLQRIFATLHSRLAPSVLNSFKTKSNMPDM